MQNLPRIDISTTALLIALTVIFTSFFLIDDHQLFMTITEWEKLEGQDVMVEEGSTTRRLGLVLLGIFGIASAVLGKTGNAVQHKGLLLPMMIFFVFWAFLSFAWTDDMGLTFRRLGVLTILCAGALGLTKAIAASQIPLLIFLVTGSYLLLGIAGDLRLGTFLPLDPEFRFAGGLHPNHQGINCSLLFLSSIFLFSGRRPLAKSLVVAVALGAISCLVLTKSRTSLIGVGSAVLAYALISASGVRRVGLIIGLGIVASFILLFIGDSLVSQVGEAALLGRQEAPQSVSMLSGRLPLWEECLEFITTRPLHGYGYGAFWTPLRVDEISRLQDWPVAEAHSAYVDMTLSLGIVGSIAYILILFTAIRRAFTRNVAVQETKCKFLGIVLVFIVVEGILESATIAPSLLFFVCIVALVYLCSFSTDYCGGVTANDGGV